MNPHLLVSILIQAHEIGVPICQNPDIVDKATAFIASRKNTNDLVSRSYPNGEVRVRFSNAFLKALDKHLGEQEDSTIILPRRNGSITP